MEWAPRRRVRDLGRVQFLSDQQSRRKGDAGALITNSEEITERVKTLRNCGTARRYEHPEAGLNSRLDELQAPILSARLDWLGEFTRRRQEIARKYLNTIDNGRIELLSPPNAEQSHVYHLFVIRCAERDRLAHFLEEQGIETLIHYPVPAHRQGCCQNLRCDPHGLPSAESHANQCLSLPCHPQLHDDDVAKVIATINQFE